MTRSEKLLDDGWRCLHSIRQACLSTASVQAYRKTSKLVIPANVKQSVYFIKDIIQQCRLWYVTYM